MTRADRGHGNAGSSCGLRESLQAILRDRAQDLVIVAAGNDGLDADDAARQQCCAPPTTTGCSGHRSRPTRRTPRRASRDRRRAHRTHPSPRWRDREPLSPAHCAAAARGSGRSASRSPRRRRPARAAAAPPFRMSSPSAASPIVPVTTTRSPGFAPLRWTILPCGHPPERRDRDHQRTRRGNRIAAEQRTAELRRVLAKPARERLQPGIVRAAQRQRQHEAGRRRALGREIGQIHPQRLARDACPADRRAENARLRRWRRSSPRCRRPTAFRIAASSIEIERAGIGRERLEIARDQRVFAGWICCDQS